MPDRTAQTDDLKRSVRQLKKLEMKIRFGPAGLQAKHGAARLVWDAFFDLHETGEGRAKYSIRRLTAMTRDEYKAVVDEFFFHVYCLYYRENGIVDMPVYDADMLGRLGLPMDADSSEIKKRFHELALKYHPDTGGDAQKFIELMDSYRKLIDKGK